MLPCPVAEIAPDSAEFETVPLVKPTGFREYDARWWLGRPGSDIAPELNLLGATALGLGLGTYLHERGAGPDVVTGHDYRSYSAAVKAALVTGLMAAGCRVHDIGLALSPMAYFAQFDLDVASVAMVTASHNENGWTGVKMGCERPLTFGPEEMVRLREIVLSGAFRCRDGGTWRYAPDLAGRYVAALVDRPRLARRLKVVVATGNGTAGAFAPTVLESIGCEVVPLHTRLDHSFPHYNPNPEDLAMLHDLAAAVKDARADLGFAFDGDGDRCGVVDDRGREIFSDKIGVLLARDIAARHPGARFVVDVKSTGLYATDPELRRHGAVTDYWKTGHSYIKRRVAELGAAAGFEKSGHFFLGPPLGRGYDDGLAAAIAVCDLLDRNPGRSLAGLYDDLPRTWASPTLSAACADEVKYEVADRVRGRIERQAEAGEPLAGQAIPGLVTVNGIRVATGDGTWGLVRASSNKPELVVVVESPVSESRMRAMFAALDGILRQSPEVGAYNQAI
jgi:phosphomannomutase / phosphoglucomutase